MNRHQVTAVCCGGIIGAVTRWGLIEILPTFTHWPWHILLINVSGSAALGLLVGHLIESPNKLLFLAAGTGFCGAFTTFSSFTIEIATAIKAREYFNSISFLVASILGGLLAYQIGKRAMKSGKARI
ncbi:MAG: CrcB family protein [Acidimicrobiales bacterium]|nr:CrcB family protein [Acidimicrobiales bacterium]